MTAFKKLFDHCQTLQPKVSTKEIKTKAIELTGAKNVCVVKDTLDTTKVRGYFLSVRDEGSWLVRAYGCNVVVLARGMNECWDRFIQTKELMHLFDEEAVKTSTPDQLRALLGDFEALEPSQDHSPQYASELKSFWMALACLCPEPARLDFLEQFKKGHIDHYGIALKLKIPEQHVRQLFRPNYRQIVESLLD